MTILNDAPLHVRDFVTGVPLPPEQIRAEAEAFIAYCQAAAGGPDCRPWCKFHDSTEPDLDSCYSHPRGTYANDAYLVDERGEWGQLIWWRGGEQKTPDEAEAFALRILALVALARAGKEVAA